MQYNEILANRVREALANAPKLEEKEMFGCLAFLVDDKLCICVQKDGLLLRVPPGLYEELLEKEGCREMQMGKRIMKGYVLIEETALQTKQAFDYWTDLALSYNKQVKAAKKKTVKKTS